jgi:hypothetical protein
MEKDLKIGKCFKSYEELNKAIQFWANEEFHPISMRSSHKLTGVPEDIAKALVYQNFSLECIHSGAPRIRKVTQFLNTFKVFFQTE